ncbi:fluoride efflux transporter family protein [Corynebacterium hindlerae]|uniref:fluoride efflux transporter family protein n=1 Tax=Corynebacterium hindlerae TaxID=699041 RepID=UPI001AD6191B|nr:fluoride efflux transporter family protein [Corynebacterium hindlerae]QTH60871.1 fluoride efflux transporter family protein [Corynebacterium hindlerae]
MDYLKVGCGAGIGAVARFALTQALGPVVWVTIAINVLGCFLMGRLRPGLFWGTGVLGGFTTFSAFAFSRDPSAMAITVIGSVAAWQVGNALAKRPTP